MSGSIGNENADAIDCRRRTGDGKKKPQRERRRRCWLVTAESRQGEDEIGAKLGKSAQVWSSASQVLHQMQRVSVLTAQMLSLVQQVGRVGRKLRSTGGFNGQSDGLALP